MTLSRPAIALLALISAFLPLATDGFLAAVQPMRVDFGLGFAAAQSSISVVLLGFACAQLVIGALADRYGRRPVLLCGTALFLCGTAGVAASPSLPVLLGWRFVQGASAASGPILSRAIVRDLYDRHEGARVLSVVSMGLACVPLLLPGLNAAVVAAAGWRAATVLPAALLVLALAMTLRCLPETQDANHRTPLSFGALGQTFREVVAQPRVVGYILCCVSGYGGLAVWISASPHLLREWYGRPATHFGLYWGLTMLAYVAGSWGSVRLLRGHTSDRILAYGSHLTVAGGAVLAASVFLLPHRLLPWLLGIGLYCAGWAMLQPQAQTGALAAFRESAGRVSALLGFAQLACGAIIAQLFGHLHDGSPFAATALIGACAIANALVRRVRCAATVAGGAAP